MGSGFQTCYAVLYNNQKITSIHSYEILFSSSVNRRNSSLFLSNSDWSISFWIFSLRKLSRALFKTISANRESRFCSGGWDELSKYFSIGNQLLDLFSIILKLFNNSNYFLFFWKIFFSLPYDNNFLINGFSIF